eukprot:m.156010 g.156010  ORF g.156010 m.156010 type:complete len:50 (-) comp14425_c0_seq1:1862-2011(-)
MSKSRSPSTDAAYPGMAEEHQYSPTLPSAKYFTTDKGVSTVSFCSGWNL